MILHADVVVVGAGPGGSAAANRLARAGADVVLLDRMTFPRSKVCGDGLTPRAIAALHSLGVWDDCAAIATPVRELVTVDLVTGSTHTGPLPSRIQGAARGAVVPRHLLDEVICRHAIAAGARFVGGVDVQGPLRDHDGSVVGVVGIVDGAKCEIHAGNVVAADGANGRLGRTLMGRPAGVLRGLAVRQYWRVSVPQAFTICVPIGSPGDPIAGYGWVFPVGSDGANVGVGFLGVTVDRVRAEYRRFIERLRVTMPRWESAIAVSRLDGGVLAAGLQYETATVKNVVFVGDAAGATNAFTGEGIAQALDSGMAAAEAIAEHAHGGALADRYWEGLRRCFPESTRNVGALPWFAERGGVFAREFWQVTSGAMRVVGRSARTITLDESSSLAPVPEGSGTKAMSALADRVCRRRPVLAQFLCTSHREIGPLIDEAIETLRSALAHGRCPSPDGPALEIAIAAVVAMISVADDTGDEPTDSRGRAVEESAVWAANSASLGISDLLVAELFEIMAELSPEASAAVAGAVTGLLARLTARSVGTPTARLQVGDVASMVRSLVDGLPVGRSHAA